MIEKIWPINKLFKLRQDVTELRQETMELCKETMQLRKETEMLNQEIQGTKGDMLKSLTEIEDGRKKLEVLFDSYKSENQKDLWMTKFGYDIMISSLQMAVVEQVVPGNYDRVKKLQNSHMGERCFIIGNGPSLTAADLDVLKENGEFCFASKRINTIFNQTEWRPDIWGASDLDYIEMYQDDIRNIKGFPKLICAQSIVRNNIVFEDAIYYPFIQVERKPQWFNEDILRGVHFYGTITCKLINFAVYMGFKEIYLLGVDNTVPIKMNEDGTREYDPKAQNHFSEDYFTEKDMVDINKNILDIDESAAYVTSAYASVKWFCDQLGVKIFNATRGGILEVYPRVDFDSIEKK